MSQTMTLPEAPGAKASWHCGLWAMITMFLCFPAALVLAIVAIVQNGKAKRLAEAIPDTYRRPGSAGLVMGILALVMLPFLAILGIVVAISIPALIGQRERARDKAAVLNMEWSLDELRGQYDRLKDARQPIKGGLEAYLGSTTGQTRNPWNPSVPAFSYAITVVDRMDEAGITREAKAKAAKLGQAVYVLQLPGAASPGLLAGAVRLNGLVQGERVVVKTYAIE
jgi:hypothetical protein